MTGPYWQREDVTLHLSDCIDVMRGMPDASVDAVVTDPPYGLEFMGRGWDGADGFRRSLNSADAARDNVFGRTSRTGPEYRAGHLFQDWCQAWASECLRVLKPGGFMLAFGGTRTWHRLVCAIEDAGFEIRDSVADLTGRDPEEGAPGLLWIYGSGFPKSLDVSKAIDKAAGAQREVIGEGAPFGRGSMSTRTRVEQGYRPTVVNPDGGSASITAPATIEAADWDGWGTALKPAWEPIAVGRKPLAGTVAQNVLRYGTGAININGCRVPARDQKGSWAGYSKGTKDAYAQDSYSKSWVAAEDQNPGSRWPPNILLSDEAAEELDRQSGVLASGANPVRRGSDKFRDTYGDFTGQAECAPRRGADTGGASRFFPVFRYQAKAPGRERPRLPDGTSHPTVKPLALMTWLISLAAAPGALILDPFAGTGTTLQAARNLGVRAIGIEQDERYCQMATMRLSQQMLTA